MYKIYEDCIKVFPDGSVEPLNDSKVKPKIVFKYQKNLGRKRADLVFKDPKDNYNEKRRSLIKLIAELYLNMPNNKKFVAVPKDDNFLNCHVDNIKIVSQSKITKKLNKRYDKTLCKDCSKEIVLRTAHIKYVHIEENLCWHCHRRRKQRNLVESNRLNEISSEFRGINLEDTALTENQIELLKLRLSGLTLKKLGNIYDVSDEAIRKKLLKIKEVGIYPSIKCKKCGTKCETPSISKYKKALKTKLCRECK